MYVFIERERKSKRVCECPFFRGFSLFSEVCAALVGREEIKEIEKGSTETGGQREQERRMQQA